MSKKLDLSGFDEEVVGELDLSGFDEDEEISQSEAALLSTAEGLTAFDLADEIYGGLGGLYDYVTKGEDKTLKEEYKEDRDIARKRLKEAQEAHPATYMAGNVLGGAVPAFLTGGATAVAGIGGALGKQAAKGALKQAVKQSAKTGAKYGAGVGLGASEAELLDGEFGQAIKDVAESTVGGAALGTALPIAGKGIKEGTKGVGRGIQKAVEFVTPESGYIKAAYQYGKQGKKIAEEVIDDDLIEVASGVYDRIIKAKKANNLGETKKMLDGLGYKVDAEGAINDAISDLEKIAREDILDITNKELLPKLQKLAGKDVQADKLIEKAQKQAMKKQLQSQGKVDEGIIKGEKAMAKHEAMSGDTLETVSDINKTMDDLPFQTSEGQLSGVEGKFKSKFGGEEYSFKQLSDATEFQPEISKILGPDGRPIIKTKDLGSGKVTAIIGDIEDKMTKDLNNLTISEVENMRKNLNLATKLAKAQGMGSDPAVGRARQLASELKDLTDTILMQHGDETLINKRARMSDLLSAEEILGIEGKLKIRGDLDKEAKIKEIADRLGFQKGFKSRQEAHTAKRLLGEGVLDKDIEKQFDLLKKVNKIVGRESQENISRAGLYKKAVGDLPNLLGRAAKAKDDIVKGISGSKIGKVANNIGDLPEDAIRRLQGLFAASESKGVQAYANQLQKALESESAIKNSMIWSLSQQPAFRQAVKEYLPKLDDEMKQDLDLTSYNEMSQMEDMPERMPAASEFLKQKETTSNTGYVPKKSSKSGVTIATGLDLGNFDIDKLEISPELKSKLSPYVGLKGDKAREVAANLQLTDEEVVEIDNAMDNYTSSETEALTEGISEDLMSVEFQEGIDSMFTNSPAAAKALIERVKAGNVDEAIDKGVEWNKTGGRFAAGLLQRRMEELYKMFPDKADLIQKEGKIEYDKYQNQTKRSWDDINTIEEKVQEVEKQIDRVNQQQSSGDEIPLPQLDDLLGKVNELGLSQEDIDGIEQEAVAMDGYGDGQRLKEMVRKLNGLS